MGFLFRIKCIKAGIVQLFKQYVSPLYLSGYGKVGKHCIISNNSAFNKKNLYIDDYCIIQDQLNLISNQGRLFVGKYSVISSGCTIIPGTHVLTVGVPFFLSTMCHINDKEGDIIIEEDCWIGAGCILLPGCIIRRGAVVGAGSIVNKEVPAYAVVVGAPARIIASKFSFENVLKHEEVLYPPKERKTIDELEVLFETNFKGKRFIGDVDISKNIEKVLQKERESFGITDFSDCK